MKIFFFDKKSNSGIGLLEVLLAVAAFAVGIGAVAHLFVGSYSASLQSMERNQAIFLAKEGIEGVRSVKNDNFENMSTGTFGIEEVDGKWSLVSGGDIIDDKYEREVIIQEINDDTWSVESTVQWNGESVQLEERLTAWTEPYLVEYDLSIDSTDGGDVDTPGEGEFAHSYGEQVELVADSWAGYEFYRWVGDTGTVNNINSPSTTITIESDHSITAEFIAEE